MIRLIIFFQLAFFALSQSLSAAEPVKMPRLVVNIIVSQMRSDYLQRFAHNFGADGFRRLTGSGIQCMNARYNYLHTNTPAGLATIQTGTNPDNHGIISDTWMDYTTNEMIRLIDDKRYFGRGCDENEGAVSPQRLVVNNVGDQLKKYSPKSKVYSVALTATSAVIGGGYSADGVYWLDGNHGKWITSNYYQERLPDWASQYNDEGFVDLQTDKVWTTLKPAAAYLSGEHTVISTDQNSGFSFDAIFKRKGRRHYDLLQETPSGGDALTEFVKQVVIYGEMGTDEVPDLLTICYDQTRLIGEKYGTESMETEDAFYCMDANLAELLHFLDVQVGKENVMVVLTSDHGASDTFRENPKLPNGRFNILQFKAILNGFLNAQLGSDDWVRCYNDRELYLNRNAIYGKGLKLVDVQNMVAGFAIQFRGVANAVTGHALQNSSFTKGNLEKIQNSYYPRYSGDLLLNLMPGWIEEEGGRLSTSGSLYRYDTHVPLVWYGPNLKKRTIYREVDMIDIAATLSYLLKIPAPEAATGVPLTEVTAGVNY